MANIKCGAVSVQEFNRAGKDRQVEGASGSVVVASNDDQVDASDTFMFVNDDGSSKILDFNSPGVQGVMKYICIEQIMDSQVASKRKAMADAFGVVFGEPQARVRCPCEQLGVYDKGGRHLFDLDSNSDRQNVPADDRPSGKRSTFTKRHLASVLADRLGRPVPEAYRAKLEITTEDRSTLEDAGCHFDEEGQKIWLPPTADGRWRAIDYDGVLAWGGFNKSVQVKPEGGNMIRITSVQDDGDQTTLLVNIKTGETFTSE